MNKAWTGPETGVYASYTPDGRIKCFVLSRLLELRRRLPATFAAGGYRRLAVTGARSGGVLAFARGTGEEEVVVIVARVHPGLEAATGCALSAAAWGDTRVELEGSRARRDWLSGRPQSGPVAAVAELVSPLPVAVLVPDSGGIET